MSRSPVEICEDPDVVAGPWLLEGIEDGPGLEAHRRRYGGSPSSALGDLLSAVDALTLRGRGGAAFSFATKLRTTAESRGRPVVVVNLSEGEPASSKDSALARWRPHLVLDGAVGTARALGSREVHVVLPGDRPLTMRAMGEACAERDDRPVRLVRHVASPRFVAGQSQAVLELMRGRPNLPVTTWTPAAVTGHRSRPTLLSNAETWAHVGRLLHTGPPVGLGTVDEPGTTLLTLRTGHAVSVREVEFGTALGDLLPARLAPAMLLGGFHGTWAAAEEARLLRVSVPGLRAAGYSLGAGLVMSVDGCPVTMTQRLVRYLAGESAGRCGPCRNGLPALATALADLTESHAVERVEELAGLLDGRGACAHPDGTVRLVRSLWASFPGEVDVHMSGRCGLAGGPVVRRLRSVAS